MGQAPYLPLHLRSDDVIHIFGLAHGSLLPTPVPGLGFQGLVTGCCAIGWQIKLQLKKKKNTKKKKKDSRACFLTSESLWHPDFSGFDFVRGHIDRIF